MPKPAKKQAAPAVSAEIAAPAAETTDQLVRWATFTDGTAHIVNKAGAPRCGHKRGKLDTVVGTLPEGRRPPCDKCANP